VELERVFSFVDGGGHAGEVRVWRIARGSEGAEVRDESGVDWKGVAGERGEVACLLGEGDVGERMVMGWAYEEDPLSIHLIRF
jgi:hypothetical protein